LRIRIHNTGDSTVQYKDVIFCEGKSIINEQFLLNRLANASIDIYAMTCMLSRYTNTPVLSLTGSTISRILDATRTKIYAVPHSWGIFT
jgi:hypothetical protein